MAADSTRADIDALLGSDDDDEDEVVVNAAGNTAASSAADKQRNKVDAIFDGSDSDSSAAAPKQKLTLKVKKKSRKVSPTSGPGHKLHRALKSSAAVCSTQEVPIIR